MAWGVEELSEQRLKFVIRAGAGKEPLSALCKEFGISRPTGYKWLQRYRECDRLQDLGEKSRRPLRSPTKTADETEQRVIVLRRQYPDWGAKKLQVLLQREGVLLPWITIHRILLRHGLVREEDRHRPALQRFERAESNQLWQMDFKGMPDKRSGCLPLVILDDHSRFLVGLFGLPGTGAAGVRQSLETVFRDAGLPQAMLMDHGTPWWNMQAESGWTWVTVWLMRQGIRLYLSGYRHPQTQGKIERSNGSLEAAMEKRGKAEEQGWQQWLDNYRQEYNQVRPHEALQMDVPARHWCRSERMFQPDLTAWEYEKPERVYTVRQNGGVSIAGKYYFISRAFVGQQVELQAVDERRVLVYFCRTPIREFDLRERTSHPIDYGQYLKARTQGLLHESNSQTARPIGG